MNNKYSNLIKIGLISLFNINICALEIVYEPRTPYIQENQNIITGLVATPLIKALENAKIDYSLKKKPAKRHLKEIILNKKAMCVIGWFKNPQREQFAKFTKPLYQDKPMGILTNIKSDINNGIKINDLLNIDKVSILIKDSYSYGAFIDERLKIVKVKKTKTSNIKMVSMIAKKRADFMFISFEEAQEIIKNHKYKNKIKFVTVTDLSKGNKRYLLCSKLVDDSIIEKLNRHIK
ncbi:MAG: transporter substrate-binding domain-containing protein [Campylobacterota bacterium]|nr:transporter substrate-binding domain-containing protein [Campylobacterota bacterium]